MTLLWGFPLGLAAFAALLVPLLLHLQRRRALRILPFAAMRWIGGRHRPRRTWRWTEWLLLALRLALVSCLALWLAQPSLRAGAAALRWLAIVPGMAASEIAAAASGADRIVWLAPGFPAQEQPAADASADTSSLLRELDARLGPDDRLRVLVPAELDGLDAAAIDLSRAVDWTVVAGSQASPTAAPVPARRRVLALRYADAADTSLPYLRAAIASWAQSASLAVDLDEGAPERALPANADALIWLGDAPDDAALASAERGAALLHIPSHSGAAAASAATDARTWPPAAQRVGRGRVLRQQTPLDPQALPALHSADFPILLHRVLFGDGPVPARAYAGHVRPRQADAPRLPPETPLRTWCAWAAAALFLVERLLANGRRLGGIA